MKQQSKWHLCALFKLRFGESQVCPYKDLLQRSGDFMVPAPRRAPGLHRVLHIHRHVVSEANPLQPFFLLAFCAFLHVAPCLCSGVWAASFMKWSPGGLFSLGRLWRMSFTSYSASWVRRRSRLMPRLQLCYFAVYYNFAWEHRGRVSERTSFHLQMCDWQVLLRKSRGPASPPVRSLKPIISLNTKLSLLSATHPGTSLHFLFLNPTRILTMLLRILFRINKHNHYFSVSLPFPSLLLVWTQDRQRWSGLAFNAPSGNQRDFSFFLCRIVFCK